MSKREADDNEPEGAARASTALVKRAKADDGRSGQGSASRAIVRSSEGSIITTVS